MSLRTLQAQALGPQSHPGMGWTQERPLTFDTLGRLLLAMIVWQPCLQSQRAGVRVARCKGHTQVASYLAFSAELLSHKDLLG